MSTTDLKKILKEKKVMFGTNQTIKGLKTGKVKEVFLANDCPEKVIEDIEHYASFSKIIINKLNQSKKDLGLVCKKNFAICVISH